MKSLIEGLLLHAGPAALARRSHRGRGLVLAYHNVVPEGERAGGDQSLHMPRQHFAEHLDFLLQQEGLEVLSLDELMSATDSSPQTEGVRRVAITFDDAYRGALTVGVEELTSRSLPATVFVVPALLGGTAFWWDSLAGTAGVGLSDEVRNAALEDARGRNEEVLAWANRIGLAAGEVPDHARSANRTELESAVARIGIELASHTWSHPNLAMLTEEESTVEVKLAADWLQENFGVRPRWLSYPYGLSSEAARRAALAGGHEGAFRIEGGWLPRESDPRSSMALPRLNIPAGMSCEGLALRLSGLLCRRTSAR